MSLTTSRGYAHPEYLVSTDWLADHLEDPSVRIIESNEDPLLYRSKHIPGAVEVDWANDLNTDLARDFLDQEAFAALASRLGIKENSTLVFYGDRNNWWACFTLWVFTMHGHQDLRILDGGRKKWEAEARPMTREVPQLTPTEYSLSASREKEIRIYRNQLLAMLDSAPQLVDVRSPEEYSGERLHMPDYPNEGALRGGHIPGALNVPWARAVDTETGEFLPADALAKIYLDELGFAPDKPTVAYCRIGERSSHTWFVLRYLLGFTEVKNYDGSWTEWGNSVGLPIER